MEASVAHRERGWALIRLDRPDEALPCFSQALALDPADRSAGVGAATALSELGRHQEALGLAERIAAEHPDWFPAFYSLARACRKAGNLPRAWQAAHHGLSLAPDHADLHLEVGLQHLASERYPEALASFARTTELAPQDPAPRLGRVVVLRLQGRRREALAEVEEVLRLEPEHPVALSERGILLIQGGGGAAAVRSTRRAVQLNPQDADYRAAHAVAVKTRNPLYGLLVRYSTWLGRQPWIVRLLVSLLPFAALVTSGAFVGDHHWLVVVMVAAVLVLVVSWTIEPLMNAVLLASRVGRVSLPRAAKSTGAFFAAMMLVLLVSVVIALISRRQEFAIVAVGSALWGVALGNAEGIAERRPRLFTVLAGWAGALALAALACAFPAPDVALVLAGVLGASGLALAWLTMAPVIRPAS